MPKASFNLPDGTSVIIEGTSEEVKNILDYYANRSIDSGKPSSKKVTQTKDKEITEKSSSKLNLAKLVNLVKDCNEADAIERNILDKSSQVDRVLLPIYIVHEYLDNAFGLSSGNINKILADLGIPMATPNISLTLSGTASRYVMGDKVRKRGQPVKYKLSRKGLTYFKEVLQGK